MSTRPSSRMITLLVILGLLAVLITWIARNTYWDHVQIPMPLRGEALWNPNYAAQRFAESLGAQTERHRVLGQLPSTKDVLILSTWHWDLIDARRRSIERWVESGGRLVVDRSLIDNTGAFARWTGIDRLNDNEYEKDPGEDTENRPSREPCRKLEPQQYELCEWRDGSRLAPRRNASWILRDDTGAQIARINVGRGSVTVLNAQPFAFRKFLEGDHARLFVAATQLARGDRVHFVSEQNHPNLLTLLWMYGAPALCLGLAWVALALWRNGVRFGPAVPPTETARRSLSEQIRGTGQFVLRYGGGIALHRAEVRALDEAAARRVPGYSVLNHEERSREIARLSNLDTSVVASAIRFTGKLRSPQFRSAIELLETARRRILEGKKGL